MCFIYYMYHIYYILGMYVVRTFFFVYSPQPAVAASSSFRCDTKRWHTGSSRLHCASDPIVSRSGPFCKVHKQAEPQSTNQQIDRETKTGSCKNHDLFLPLAIHRRNVCWITSTQGSLNPSFSRKFAPSTFTYTSMPSWFSSELLPVKMHRTTRAHIIFFLKSWLLSRSPDFCYWRVNGKLSRVSNLVRGGGKFHELRFFFLACDFLLVLPYQQIFILPNQRLHSQPRMGSHTCITAAEGNTNFAPQTYPIFFRSISIGWLFIGR